MLPVVSIIGKSNLGKTILMEGLIWGLKSRGYRVATVRYTSQGMIFDVPDKDNRRHLQAGNGVTVISSPDRVVLVKPVAQTLTFNGVAHFIGEDCDIILNEGFTQGNPLKIEVRSLDISLMRSSS